MTNQNNHPNNDMKAVRGLGQLPNASTKLPTLTNQNNELDQILDNLYCDAWFAGRVAEREQSGIRSVTPKFDEAKQAIQALYASTDHNSKGDCTIPHCEDCQANIKRARDNAPKPVDNGELREQISNLMADLMVEAKLIGLSNRQNMLKQGYCYISAHNGQLNEIMVLIQAHTNAEIAKVLDRLEQNEMTMFNRNDTLIHAVPIIAIQAERAKLKEVK